MKIYAYRKKILLLLLLMQITACQPMLKNDLTTTHEMDTFFKESIVVGGEIIFSGLRLVQSDEGEIISLHIFNDSNEPISFPNHFFGVQGFCPDLPNKQWKPYKLLFLKTDKDPTIVTLPPKFSESNFEVVNELVLLKEVLKESNCNELRLLVIGTGNTTNTVYGAYIDIGLNP